MIFRDIFQHTIRQFLLPVVPYLDDDRVTEILINGHDTVIVERAGQLIHTDARFEDEQHLLSAIRHLSQFVGRPVSVHRPILEGRLPDGSRLEAIVPPAAPDGPHLAIRRFSKDQLTMARLIEFGALGNDAANLLESFIGKKQNVLVAGGTGSGKTSMLNALSSYIGDTERIIVIEDARELQLQRSHVVQLEAQGKDPQGRGEVTVRDLFRATLRMRPDRIIIGEIRGAESLELIQAMTSGHGGCMSTVHASNPKDALSRLETMALMSDVELPLLALRGQIASAIHLIVQTSRLADGCRGVTHITQVQGLGHDGTYELRDLFVRSEVNPNIPGSHDLVPTEHGRRTHGQSSPWSYQGSMQ